MEHFNLHGVSANNRNLHVHGLFTASDRGLSIDNRQGN